MIGRRDLYEDFGTAKKILLQYPFFLVYATSGEPNLAHRNAMNLDSLLLVLHDHTFAGRTMEKMLNYVKSAFQQIADTPVLFDPGMHKTRELLGQIEPKTKSDDYVSKEDYEELKRDNRQKTNHIVKLRKKVRGLRRKLGELSNDDFTQIADKYRFKNGKLNKTLLGNQFGVSPDTITREIQRRKLGWIIDRQPVSEQELSRVRQHHKNKPS